MSIRMHILLMLLWEMFWLPFLMFSGYVVGALVVNHEAAIFVGIVVGFFLGASIGHLDVFKGMSVHCPYCGMQTARRTRSVHWNYYCSNCRRTKRTGWRESDPSDQSFRS